MKISREKLLIEAAETGFRAEILEKVFYLLGLLNGFRDHPSLRGRFALKGGSAINLFLLDLPRLSVDIDINYVGAVDRAAMEAERPKIERAIIAVCGREGLSVKRVPGDYAGGKWRLHFGSAIGQGGSLEIDINFILRVPLWPIQEKDSNLVGSLKATGIPILDLHELAAGKLTALFGRKASRDLFDSHRLLRLSNLERKKLRLAFVVYGGINRKDWRKVSIDNVAFEPMELQEQLFPVLRGDDAAQMMDKESWARRMVKECQQGLEMVLPLDAHEHEFLDRLLERGDIVPSLLTDDADLVKRIASHPGLLWKALNVRKFKGIT